VNELRLSEKIAKIKESGTVRFTPIVEKLRKQEKDIISLAVGEPDFDTPEKINQATINAIKENKTRYSDVSGLPELKLNICLKLKNQNNISCAPENIIITNGSKQALFNIFQVISNPGDEVIINKPFWPTYEEQVKCGGGVPVFVDTINHQLDIEAIRKAITPKTKSIVINSPNNPTGGVYIKEDLEAVGEIAIKHNLFIISDEAYETLVFDGLKHHSIASFSEEIKKRTISVFSFSKAHNMTGFRIGYAVAEKKVIDGMHRLQSHSTGNVCTFAQKGAIKALDIESDFNKKQTKLFEKRRDLTFELARKLFNCIKPQGAFYIFPNIKKNLSEEVPNATAFVNMLLEKTGIVSIPGEVFGVKDHIRIAYTLDEDKIKEAFERIEKVLK